MIHNPMKTPDRKRLASNSRFIFHPNRNKGWAYAHHPFITVFKNRFYAVFSNGIEKEDRPHQRVLLSASDDAIRWEEPVVLFDRIEGRPHPGVLTPGGFHIHNGRLVCYAGLFEFEEEAYRSGDYSRKAHSYANLYAKTTSVGNTWSDAVDLRLPVLPHHGPQRLDSGRLLISGNFTFPYTDDPAGLSGWTLGGIYPRVRNHLVGTAEKASSHAENYKAEVLYNEISSKNAACTCFPTPLTHPKMRGSSPAFTERVATSFMDTPYGHTVNSRELSCGTDLCEGSFFQTPDGVIHMLLRSLSGKLWLTESRDNGETWSKPRESGFTDCGNKFHFGKIGNHYYAVSTPDPGNPRFPLVLSLSTDGVCFERQFVVSDTEPGDFVPPVARTGKIFGYPHSCVVGDTLYIIASLCKSGILVFEVRLKDLF